MTGPLEALGNWANKPSQAGGDIRARIDMPFTLEGNITGPFTEEQALNSGSLNYFIRPPANEIYYISRLLMRALSASFTDASEYGNAQGTLPTGIAIKLWDEGADELIYNFTPVRIQAIHDWVLYAGVDALTIDPAASVDGYGVRWTFTKAQSGMVVLDGSEDQVLRMEIPTALSNLVSHITTVQGYKKLA